MILWLSLLLIAAVISIQELCTRLILVIIKIQVIANAPGIKMWFYIRYVPAFICQGLHQAAVLVNMVLDAGRIVTVPVIYDFYIGHMVIYTIHIPGGQLLLTLASCFIIQQELPIRVIIMFRLLVRNDKDSRIFPVKADFYILCRDSILLKQLGMGFCKSFLLPVKSWSCSRSTHWFFPME